MVLAIKPLSDTVVRVTDRLYERISLDTLVSGSITKQHGRLKDHARKGFVVYEERSVSAAKVPFADRPKGGELLADLRKGDRVLVTKIDRAARNVRDLLNLVERIEDAGASIVFVDQNIDTSGPMGRFLLTLLGAIAELEAAIVAERVRETRESFRSEGRFGGGPVPFGLITSPNPAGRGLVLRPDPDTAPLAREVVERVRAGESQRSLAPLLGLGEPGFSRWLRNPALAGIRPGAKVALDPEAAILGLAEWQALQDYLARPSKAWTRADGFGAALVCAICGDRLYYGANRRYPDSSVYRCGRRKHEDGDPAVAVVRRHADALIEQQFLDIFGDWPVIENVTSDSSSARDEAVALARLHVARARAAQDEAETDEEEEAAHADYLAAKRELREAEALPSESVTARVETGRTYREEWSAADDTHKVALLLAFGPWIVEPGRNLPIEEKVHLDTSTEDYLTGQTD